MAENNINIQIVGDSNLAANVVQSEEIYNNIKGSYDIWQKFGKTKAFGDQDKIINQFKSQTKEAEKLNKAIAENVKANKLSSNSQADLFIKITALSNVQKELKKNYDANATAIVKNDAELKKLRSEYSNTTKEIQKNAQAVGLLEKFQKTQNLSINELRILQTQLTTQYNSLTEAERKNTEQGKALTANLSLISTKIKEGREAVGDFRDSVGDYGRAITKNTELLKDLILKQEMLKKSNQQNSTEYIELQKEIVQTTAKIVQYKSAVEIVDKQVNKLTSTNKTAGLGFKDIFSGFTAAALVQKGIQLITQEIKYAVEAITEFEVALDSLAAITGLTGDGLDTIKNRAIELSNQTGIAAKDILKSFELVGSARPELLKDADALANLTSQVLTLQQAGGLETAEATTALTGALNQLGIEASEADRVINVLAASSLEGTGSISFLNDVFEKTGASAKTAGLSVEQLAAAAEIIAPKINKGSEAGTQLNNVLLRLQEQGKGFQSGTFDLRDALIEAQEEIDSYGTEAEKVAARLQIFEKSNITAGITLLDNIDTLGEFEAKITGTNVAYEQAATRTDNLATATERLKATYTNFILSLNEGENSLSGFAKGAVDKISELFIALQNSEELKSTLDQYVNIFKDLFGILESVFSIFGSGTEKVSAFESIIKILATTTKIGLLPLRGLIKVIEFLVSGIKLGIDFVKNIVERFKEFASSSEFLTGVLDKVKKYINFITFPLRKLGEGVVFLLKKIGILKKEVEALAVTNKIADLESLKTKRAVADESVEIVEESLEEQLAAYQSYIDAINDLEQLRINSLKDSLQKELDQNELNFKQLEEKYAGNKKALELIEITYQNAKQEIIDKYAKEELDKINELEELKISLLDDGLDKELSAIEQKYKVLFEENSENAEKLLLLQQLKDKEISEAIIENKLDLFAKEKELEEAKFNVILSTLEETALLEKEFELKKLNDELKLLQEIYGVETNFEIELIRENAKVVQNEIDKLKKEAELSRLDNFLVKLLNVSGDELPKIKEGFAEVYAATSDFYDSIRDLRTTNIENKISEIQELQDVANSEINAELKKVEELKKLAETQTGIEKQKTQALINEANLRINGKKSEYGELAAEEERQALRLKNIQKRAILAQLAIDQASAISSLIKYAEGNPANLFTAGLAGNLQLIAGLIRISANFVNARNSIKQLRKGEVDIDGDGTETSDSIPAMLSRRESVINAKSTKQYKNTLIAINENKNIKDVQNALEKDFGQKTLNNHVANIGFDSLELKLQNMTLKQQNDYLKRLVELAENESKFVSVGNSIFEINKNGRKKTNING
jgi:TP901 family phage tail tape measure protein